MDMAELVQWWNLLFVLPFVGALFYVLMLCVGAFPADHGTDLDAHADTDIGMDSHAELNHPVGVEHVHDIEPGLLARALSFVGVGRVPLSIIVISFCLLWGFFGFTSNSLFRSVLPPFLFVWVSLAVAFAVSIFLTRALAGLLSRVMPATETYAVSLEQLTGRWAEAITTIDETFGQAHVYDDAGTLHTVQCLVRRGEDPIPRDTQVLLLLFDKEQGVFLAAKGVPADPEE
jgi:hypothetical protein